MNRQRPSDIDSHLMQPQRRDRTETRFNVKNKIAKIVIVKLDISRFYEINILLIPLFHFHYSPLS